jgi:hypothetical protein
LDRRQRETAKRIKAFDVALSTRLGDATHELPDVIPGSSFFHEDVEEKREDGEPANNEPAYADGEEGAFLQDDYAPDSFDACLNAELLLPDSGDNTV